MRTTTQFCVLFNGKGSGRVQKTIARADQSSWIHLDYKNPQAQEWLQNQAKLPRPVLDGLMDEDTHPRSLRTSKGLLVVLRGVNLTKKAEIEDMIALHFYLEKNRLITVSHRPAYSVQLVLNQLRLHKGPRDVQECFLRLIEAMTERIYSVVEDIADEVDEIEEKVIDITVRKDTDLRNELSDVRHRIVGLRRYLAPQKEVCRQLPSINAPYMPKEAKSRWQEIIDALMQAVEELDFARDHSNVSQEELDAKVNLNISRTMYLLSVVTVIFMPLTLISGMLGANVQGIPVSSHPFSFWFYCLLVLVVGIVQVVLLKWLKLF